MVLNIFPRRKETATQTVPVLEPEVQLPEPSPEALDNLEEPKKRTRRGSRGGRGRSRAGMTTELAADEAESDGAVAPLPEPEAVEMPVARRAPRTRTTAASRAAEAAAAAEAAPVAEVGPAALAEPVAEPRARRARGRAAAPAADGVTPPAGLTGDTAAILRAIEAQQRQIEQLIRLQEEAARRGSHGPGGAVAAPPARVGVFVDSANIELACDRLRARFDWGKVLAMLTKDRQLVRAVAYSPVHDDPGVSMETQRFAEPFLGKGFKVVTKALKRFSDGSVKANVDIELALDIVTMLDRLDVVCLVSGDGDFQPLVNYVQNKGVRCEVIGVGTSTAMNLKNAADEYIDLAQRLKEVRV
ncbi:MAG: NYN domain-containing protein [Chloroflexi bacterium]|nr:NYN domain-containing protein [Chloroflexota bacterium]